MTFSIPAALALLLLAGPLAAQPVAAAAGVLLPSRRLVQVRTSAGTRFYGRLLAHDADSLVLSAPTAAGRRATAWAAVDSLWVQDGTAAVPLGLAGALALATASGWLAHGFSGGDDGPPCRATCLLRASGAGAGAGLLLGAAFGRLFPTWRRAYPAGRAQARLAAPPLTLRRT